MMAEAEKAIAQEYMTNASINERSRLDPKRLKP